MPEQIFEDDFGFPDEEPDPDEQDDSDWGKDEPKNCNRIRGNYRGWDKGIW
mgnify:CR=1 FL=1